MTVLFFSSQITFTLLFLNSYLMSVQRWVSLGNVAETEAAVFFNQQTSKSLNTFLEKILAFHYHRVFIY